MELRSGASGSGNYKKYLPLFDEGTPQEWIDIQKDFQELWTQNGMKTPADKMAIIKAVLRGETLTTFKAVVA